jgi:hypothetical protein
MHISREGRWRSADREDEMLINLGISIPMTFGLFLYVLPADWRNHMGLPAEALPECATGITALFLSFSRSARVEAL